MIPGFGRFYNKPKLDSLLGNFLDCIPWDDILISTRRIRLLQKNDVHTSTVVQTSHISAKLFLWILALQYQERNFVKFAKLCSLAHTLSIFKTSLPNLSIFLCKFFKTIRIHSPSSPPKCCPDVPGFLTPHRNLRISHDDKLTMNKHSILRFFDKVAEDQDCYEIGVLA